MNRILLSTYLAVIPIASFIILYVLGFGGIMPGFLLTWAHCLLILVVGPANCGYYVDGSALLLDVLFYTALGYALLGFYKLVKGGRSSPSPPSKRSIGQCLP